MYIFQKKALQVKDIPVSVPCSSLARLRRC